MIKMTVYQILTDLQSKIDEVLDALKSDLRRIEMKSEKIKFVEFQYISIARHYYLRVVYEAPIVVETTHFVFFSELHSVVTNKELAMLIAQVTSKPWGTVIIDFNDKTIKIKD